MMTMMVSVVLSAARLLPTASVEVWRACARDAQVQRRHVDDGNCGSQAERPVRHAADAHR
eukprot:6200064-Pleurochrysis_carterae.AAC.1